MTGGLRWSPIHLVLLCCALSGALSRSLPVDGEALYNMAAAGIVQAPQHSWPNNPLYADPWVQQNIAITYAHRTRDGVGAQTMRLLGIYAIAKSLNLQYLHRPIQCVGHVDGKVHFRDGDCSYLSDSDMRLMNKIRHMVTLPSNVTEADVQGWSNQFIEYAGWTRMTKMIRSAYDWKRPTLLTIEFPSYVLQKHPDMYFSVPAFRPEQPSARLVCRAAQAQDQAIAPGRSWLLNGLRIAVHFRRGDIAENKRWHDRMLPPAYYVNVVKSMVQVMDELGCDFTVEVYTETPTTPEGEAELRYMKEHMPAVVMLISTDLSWSWQMMSTADVLIMSNSAFSLSAAVMNPNALNVFFPNAKSRQARIRLDHWFQPLDMHGTLPHTALDHLRARLLMFKNTTEIQQNDGHYNVSQAALLSVLHPSVVGNVGAVQLMSGSPSTAAISHTSSGAGVTGTGPTQSLQLPWQLAAAAATTASPPSTAQPPSGAAAMPPTAAPALPEDVAPDAAPLAEEQELLDEAWDFYEPSLSGTEAVQTPSVSIPGAVAALEAVAAAAIQAPPALPGTTSPVQALLQQSSTLPVSMQQI